MAAKNLPARPAYESLIAMMQLHRDYHRKGFAYLSISTEMIDELIKEHAAFAAAKQPQVEVPDALITIARRLLADREKNNHFTADPIYTVQREARVYGLDTDYAEHFAWIEDSEVCASDLSARLERRFNRGWTIPDRYRRVGYCTRWEFIDAYLSYDAAKERVDYEIRKHSGNFRTYVESGCRNHEWKALQAWLLSIAAPQPQISAEPVAIEAVAEIKLDSEGQPYVDWLLEGGINAMQPGDVLLASPESLTDDNGMGYVYAAAEPRNG